MLSSFAMGLSLTAGSGNTTTAMNWKLKLHLTLPMQEIVLLNKVGVAMEKRHFFTVERYTKN